MPEKPAASIGGLTALLLVGGLGTRLRPLTYRVPKPLIRIRGKPFIFYVLKKLASCGVRNCLLLTGYKHLAVKSYCKNGSRWGMRIAYSRESKPLGTGGALLYAKGKPLSTFLALNGDSYVDINLDKFMEFHRKSQALATVYSMRGSLQDRGAIKAAKNGRVIRFLEKQKSGEGWFNTGAYLMEPQALSLLAKKFKGAFSLEREGFPLLIKSGKLFAFRGSGRFLDMGSFESLKKAGSLL